MSSPYSPYPQGGDQYGGYGQYPQGGGGWEPNSQRGYLQGAPVGLGQAISLAVKNIFTYNGRASRSAYWWFILFNFIVAVVLVVLTLLVKPFIVLVAIWDIAVFLTQLSLGVRRLHDSDRSGFWMFIAFVPFIGGIWLLILMVLPGTPGPNRHG